MLKSLFIFVFSIYQILGFCQIVGDNSILQSSTNSTAYSKLNPLNKITPLKIGHKVPDIEFAMVNYPGNRIIHLSNFKNKLILLDFWATWCAPCIRSFPKLDSIQKIYKDRLQIILVNSAASGDTEKKIQACFQNETKKNNNIPYQLYSTVGDNIADRLFPHNGVPHIVWITPDNRVSAITSSKEVTKENIEKILSVGYLDVPVKIDFENKKIMNLPPDITIDEFEHYSFFKKGNIKELPTILNIRTWKNHLRGIAVRNFPIWEIYKTAALLNKRFNSVYDNELMVLEVKDTSKVIFNSLESQKEEWNKENLYTYDIITPELDSNELCKTILDELNKYSKYYGRFEKRKTKCLVLIRTSNIDKIRTKGGPPVYQHLHNEKKKEKKLLNISMEDFVAALNRISSISYAILDETGYKNSIDMNFYMSLNNLPDLKKSLNQYDLDLVEAEREIELFILSDK